MNMAAGASYQNLPAMAVAGVDPTRLVPRPGGHVAGAAAPGKSQRNRRSTILAAIRRLLIEEGYEGVTVRRIAECSGHAVQTIYNLVGPRDFAITEAVGEYSQYVLLTAATDPSDPYASAAMIDQELKSIELSPEFCRAVCKIYFTESRNIFYDIRARQLKVLHQFLAEQQKAGVIQPGIDTRGLAEHLMLLISSLCIEWSDRSFPFEQLQRRLYAGYSSLMAEAIVPSMRRSQTGAWGQNPRFAV
jgi:AcrR family transcriptional regulator